MTKIISFQFLDTAYAVIRWRRSWGTTIECLLLVLMAAACWCAVHTNSLTPMWVHPLMAVLLQMSCDLVHPYLYTVIFRAPSSYLSWEKLESLRYIDRASGNWTSAVLKYAKVRTNWYEIWVELELGVDFKMYFIHGGGGVYYPWDGKCKELLLLVLHCSVLTSGSLTT